MKLLRVEINNFRSIENAVIKFEPKCRVLVGINESGKSNILKALNLLSSDEEPSKEDQRYDLDDENIEHANVNFIFKLENQDQKEIATSVNKKILKKSNSKQTPFILNGVSLSVENVCNSQTMTLYKVDIINEKKIASWYTLRGYSIEKGWKKPIAGCPATVVILDQNNKAVPLSTFALIAPEVERDSTLEAYLTDVTSNDINLLFGMAIHKQLNDNLPECVYWTYSDEYLLPAKINLTKFIADPTTCRPLESMFELAGIDDIETEFDKAKARKHGERNLLEKVSKAATKHIKSIWKEYKSIEISLHPNGDYIDAGVKDKTNLFDFSARSDGFKRFVSFLLMISAKVKTKNLQNTLILIDEPEVGIHPSGAKHLLAELLNIAEENSVVFSTHSIFMIDRGNISRHLIVEKQNEKTNIKEVDHSNFQDEEVIYNALGCSVFELVREKNILFEGWKDKKLFQVALSKVPEKYKHLKDKFKDIGVTHSQGARDAGKIASILDLAGRGYLIISDDDDAAKEAQKKFQGYAGSWKRYSEIITAKGFVTGEDFIVKGAVIRAIDIVRDEFKDIPDIADADLDGAGGKIAVLKGILHKQKIPKNTIDEIVKRIKDVLVENLKQQDIESEYYELLNAIEIK